MVLDFWFGGLESEAEVPTDRLRFWFGGDRETDRLVRERFAPLLAKAAAGACEHWRESSKGILALIVLFDQFPRNIYRGSDRAYAFDPQALELCLAGGEREIDLCLSIPERAFFYLPLEHAEDLVMQERSVRAFETLLQAAPEGMRPMCGRFLDYARRHREVIERFGRFPHRNAALGRPSTEREAIFLNEPGSSF